MKKSSKNKVLIIIATICCITLIRTSFAQTSSLCGKEYTIDFFTDYLSVASLNGKYLFSKNGCSTHLQFEGFTNSWDTTVIIQPNSVFPMFFYNSWFYLHIGVPQLVRISSSDTLFVIGTAYDVCNTNTTGLQYEVCTQIPKHYSGNQYIIPGVYQSTRRDVLVYPVDYNIPISYTLTANANDTLFSGITYTDTILYETYPIMGDSPITWGEFILDSLMPNSFAGSTIGVENCKQIRIQGSIGNVASYPHQYSSDLLVSQLCNQIHSTAGWSNLLEPYNTYYAIQRTFNSMYEDLFPINTMGRKYICSPPPGGFEIASFTAPYNNTIISLDGVAWDTLNARESRVKLFKETAYIESSQPLSMVISHSFMCDSTGWFWGGGGMIQVPALEQTATSGWFFYPSLKFIRENATPDYIDQLIISLSNLDNYLNQEKSNIIVVTPTVGANQTVLNNINIGAIFQPVAGNPQYSTARIEINTGFNEISNPNGLIVWSTSYQTLTDSLAPFGNYICYGAPLVMSFNKPTYEAKINTTPIENTLINPYTICVGTPLQYTVVTNADSNLTNVWEFGDGSLMVGDTVFHTYADTGYYHVNLFVNSYCDTIKGLVHVVAPPTVSLGNDTIICQNTPLTLNASVAANADYLWNTGSTSPQITVNDIGEYSVKVTTDIGCVIVDTINVDLYDPINVFLGNDTILCYLASILLDATQPQKSDAQYMWQDSSTNSTYTVIYQGQYWVVVSNMCTLQSDTINIEELLHPTINLGNDTTLCINNSIILDATIPWGIHYQWENGTTTANRLITSEGVYWVVASNPCVSASDTITIKFDNCEPMLLIPNVFTPNGDGINDFFLAGAIQNISKLNILIFNRWGEKIFESNNPHFEWDGKYKNQNCPEAVYFWVIKYVDIYGNNHEASGTVTLFR